MFEFPDIFPNCNGKFYSCEAWTLMVEWLYHECATALPHERFQPGFWAY